MACLPSPRTYNGWHLNILWELIIDGTARLTLPSVSFIAEGIASHSMWEVTLYSFLVEHLDLGEKVLVVLSHFI